MFQNYALFRHMTVADNIEFALRVRRMVPPSARAAPGTAAAGRAGGHGQPAALQLSGGQQQRVAVARALAHKPEVLLLDEPFGALDAKIREELRRTIREVQRELGITTILVTHDQEEAFALADRIGIMNLGRLLEFGRPGGPVCAPVDALRGDLPGRRQPGAGPTNGARDLHRRRSGHGPGRHGGAGGGRDHEVVAVLRPEDIEIAPSRDELRRQLPGAWARSSSCCSSAPTSGCGCG